MNKLFHELPTPCLLLDYVKLKENIALMQDHCNNTGMQLRPHAKTHKCTNISQLQMQSGAKGICCARLKEAKSLSRVANDILITSPLVTEHSLKEVIALDQSMREQYGDSSKLAMVLDHESTIDKLESLLSQDHKLRVFLDVDPGLRRTGCRPENAMRLIRRIDASAKLILSGLQAYAGHIMHEPDKNLRMETVKALNTQIIKIIDEAAEQNIAIEVISKGGTGTWQEEAETILPYKERGINVELQAGSYVFMDTEYRQCMGYETIPFQDALFVMATVISVPSSRVATIDAGIKSISTDTCLPTILTINDKICDSEFKYQFTGDEHGALVMPKNILPPSHGSKTFLLPSHCDPTVNLYRNYYVYDAENSFDVWMIDDVNP